MATGSVTPQMVSGRMGKQGRARPVASGQWCNIYGPEKEGTLSRQ